MTKHKTIFFTLTAVALLFVGGCQSAGESNREPSSTPRPEYELPPLQAAKVCLVTARELDRNGYDLEAIDRYEKARQLDPSLTAISRRLAVLYDRQGNDGKAVAEYRAALKETPDDAELLNDFGYFYVSRNDGAEAERWLRLAIAKDASVQRAWVNLGVAMAEQRRYVASYEAFSRVLPPAQAKCNLGVLQAQQGDYALAHQSLTQATIADPSLSQAKAALQWLRKKLNLPANDTGPR